jgi:hypothetical protein
MRNLFRAAHDAPGSPGAPDSPSQEGATTLLEREETAEDSSEGDRFAHYVRKDRIAASAASGRPVVALCGKVWTPRRDPSRYPVCPACKEILESIRSGGKDGGKGKDG